MMFTPWGPRAVPTGGAGVAAPAWSCTLTSAAIFFLGGMVRKGPYVVVLGGSTAVLGSDLLDLAEAQLDRGLPAEDLDEGLDPLRLDVDLGDRGVEGRERPVDDHHRVGDVEVRPLDLLARRGGGGAAAGRSGRGRLGTGLDGGAEHVLDLL